MKLITAALLAASGTSHAVNHSFDIDVIEQRNLQSCPTPQGSIACTMNYDPVRCGFSSRKFCRCCSCTWEYLYFCLDVTWLDFKPAQRTDNAVAMRRKSGWIHWWLEKFKNSIFLSTSASCCCRSFLLFYQNVPMTTFAKVRQTNKDGSIINEWMGTTKSHKRLPCVAFVELFYGINGMDISLFENSRCCWICRDSMLARDL